MRSHVVFRVSDWTKFVSHEIPPLAILAAPLVLGLVVYLIVAIPEVLFGLFVIAGQYKADARLAFVQQRVDLTLLFCLLAICGALYHAAFRRKSIIKPSPLVFLPYLAIATLATFTLIYTSAPAYGMDKLLRFITITGAACFLPYGLFQNPKAMGRFLGVFVVLAVVMSVDMVSGGVDTTDTHFRASLAGDQEKGGYIGPARIGGLAFIALAFYFCWVPKSLWKVCFSFCLLVPVLVPVFLSGARGPAVALGLSVAGTQALVATLNGVRKSSRGVIKLAVITGGVLSLLFVLRDYANTFLLRMEAAIQSGGDSLTGRSDRFSEAISIMTSFPEAFTGVGIGGFSTAFTHFDDRVYPHNIFLEIGSELGILGLLAFVVFSFSSFSRGLAALHCATWVDQRYLSKTLIALFLYMLLNACVSGDINDNRLLFAFAALIDVTKRTGNSRWRITPVNLNRTKPDSGIDS